MAHLLKYFRSKTFVAFFLFMSQWLLSQADSVYPVFQRNMRPGIALKTFYGFKKMGYNSSQIFSQGYNMVYHGNDLAGDSLMLMAMASMDTLRANTWHAYSVQHTKNGNYNKTVEALKKATALNAAGVEGYFGWVLLYYLRDYKKALTHLQHYDAITPNVVDFPVGENIHFLQGLCYYQLKQYDSAYMEFHKDIDWIIKDRGLENVNGFSFFYAARCMHQLKRVTQAQKEYEQAIKLTMFPTEAHYYCGLLLAKTNPSKARQHLVKAGELIKQGFKQQDIYVELFDEVYPEQITEALTALK